MLREVSVGLAYIMSQENITATIKWFAITMGRNCGTAATKRIRDHYPF